jgi:L-ascorbate metabolism protein UlaG (beta-lactamase superfamily)
MEDREHGFVHFLRWRFSSPAEYTQQEENYLPQLIPDLLLRIKALPETYNFMTWIGHATFLLRLNGVYFLTDPMLSERALLPRRYTQPALSKKELKQLDGPLHVIISHNHYDHLDVETIRALPVHAHIHVPLGLKEYIKRFHTGAVSEHDWWDEVEISGAVLTCLPAQHWSRRIWQGENSTLWAGYMLQMQDHVIYFGGDSGYFIGYKEFARRFPPIDYALLATTAYHPRWFMHYPHMNVEEAILAFHDLGAEYFVPTQWGTFRLGDNPPGFPMLELQRAITDQGLDESKFIMPQLGEIIEIEQ